MGETGMKPNFVGKNPISSSNSLVLSSESGVSVPGLFCQWLRPHQREGIRFLYCRYSWNSGGILADDMGMGKTIQVIGFIAALLAKTNRALCDVPACQKLRQNGYSENESHKIFLIISPASVMYNWERELETWGYYVSARFHGAAREETLRLARLGRLEIVLTTFETARDYYNDLNLVLWTAIIVDEVHKIKDPKSMVTISLKSMRCKCLLGLTGTLVQNNYDELWCILDWAVPGCLDSQKAFSRSFSSPIEKGLRKGAPKWELLQSKRLQKKLDELKCAWILRRTKNDINMTLPRKTDRIIFCRPTLLQLNFFRAMLDLDEMKQMLRKFGPQDPFENKSFDAILNLNKSLFEDRNDEVYVSHHLLFKYLHLFLKAANHVALLSTCKTNSEDQALEGSNICESVFQHCPQLLRSFSNNSFLTLSDPIYSGKMKVLVRLLEAFEEEKCRVLIFSHSTFLLHILESFIQSKGYVYRRIDGTTKSDQRTKIVEDFNGDESIFLLLISTKAGGLGLNITGANSVVIFDPSWNPSHDLQAQDRAYRIGQTQDVNVYRLITAGCIEENIYMRQVYKEQISRNAVDSVGAVKTSYFRAVRGYTEHQGELFGLANLFDINTSDTKRFFTSQNVDNGEIFSEQGSDSGQGEISKCSVKKQMLDTNLSPVESILLHADEIVQVLLHKFNKKGDGDCIIECKNNELTSSCDLRFVPRKTVYTSAPSQLRIFRSDRERIFMTSTHSLIYGSTPSLIARGTFNKICQKLGHSRKDMAQIIVEMKTDPIGKCNLLKDFYSDEDITALYDSVIKDFRQEIEHLNRPNLSTSDTGEVYKKNARKCQKKKDAEAISSTPSSLSVNFTKLQKNLSFDTEAKKKQGVAISSPPSFQSVNFTKLQKNLLFDTEAKKKQEAVISSPPSFLSVNFTKIQENISSDTRAKKPKMYLTKPPPQGIYYASSLIEESVTQGENFYSNLFSIPSPDRKNDKIERDQKYLNLYQDLFSPPSCIPEERRTCSAKSQKKSCFENDETFRELFS